MKAFLVGFIFLLAVCTLAGVGLLLSPVFILITFVLRLILGLLLVVLAIWLLGKFIIFVWGKMFASPPGKGV
jgi:hypothetical protein